MMAHIVLLKSTLKRYYQHFCPLTISKKSNNRCVHSATTSASYLAFQNAMQCKYGEIIWDGQKRGPRV